MYDRRISAEVEGELLGDEFKGYVFRISGGNDKQGFAMKQGVLTASRVRLLFSKGMSCYRPRCKGERKRKSTRGCIVSSEMSVVNLVVVKKGETVRVVVFGFWFLSVVLLPESEDELVRASSCMDECIFVVVCVWCMNVGVGLSLHRYRHVLPCCLPSSSPSPLGHPHSTPRTPMMNRI